MSKFEYLIKASRYQHPFLLNFNPEKNKIYEIPFGYRRKEDSNICNNDFVEIYFFIYQEYFCFLKHYNGCTCHYPHIELKTFDTLEEFLIYLKKESENYAKTMPSEVTNTYPFMITSDRIDFIKKFVEYGTINEEKIKNFFVEQKRKNNLRLLKRARKFLKKLKKETFK